MLHFPCGPLSLLWPLGGFKGRIWISQLFRRSHMTLLVWYERKAAAMEGGAVTWMKRRLRGRIRILKRILNLDLIQLIFGGSKSWPVCCSSALSVYWGESLKCAHTHPSVKRTWRRAWGRDDEWTSGPTVSSRTSPVHKAVKTGTI